MAERSDPAASDGGPPAVDYLQWSRTPLAGLLFLLPFLGLYELAILTGSDPSALRNPAESWLRGSLLRAGDRWPWLLPSLVAGSLLLWHAVVRYRQGPGERIDSRGTILAGMLGESTLLAAALVFAGQATHAVVTDGTMMSLATTPTGPGAWAAACLGAGIYEEVLFRLWAVPLSYLLLRLFVVPPRIAVAAAIVSTSLLFAAAHYPAAAFSEPPDGMTAEFAFRVAAGLAFASLFWLRGFGVAVGTHVLYDAIIVVVTAVQQPG